MSADIPTVDRLLKEPSRRALVEALDASGGELAPGELANRTGMAERTCSRHLRLFRDGGLVGGDKRRVRLLSKGALALARVRESLPPPPVPPRLGEAIARWPAVEQQAFARAGIGTVVSRHLFGELRPDDHSALATIGTGTGKTALGLFIGRVVKLEDVMVRCRSGHPARSSAAPTTSAAGGAWLCLPRAWHLPGHLPGSCLASPGSCLALAWLVPGTAGRGQATGLGWHELARRQRALRRTSRTSLPIAPAALYSGALFSPGRNSGEFRKRRLSGELRKRRLSGKTPEKLRRTPESSWRVGDRLSR